MSSSCRASGEKCGEDDGVLRKAKGVLEGGSSLCAQVLSCGFKMGGGVRLNSLAIYQRRTSFGYFRCVSCNLMVVGPALCQTFSLSHTGQQGIVWFGSQVLLFQCSGIQLTPGTCDLESH